jgi:hypothetical protein
MIDVQVPDRIAVSRCPPCLSKTQILANGSVRWYGIRLRKNVPFPGYEQLGPDLVFILARYYGADRCCPQIRISGNGRAHEFIVRAHIPVLKIHAAHRHSAFYLAQRCALGQVTGQGSGNLGSRSVTPRQIPWFSEKNFSLQIHDVGPVDLRWQSWMAPRSLARTRLRLVGYPGASDHIHVSPGKRVHGRFFSGVLDAFQLCGRLCTLRIGARAFSSWPDHNCD